MRARLWFDSIVFSCCFQIVLHIIFFFLFPHLTCLTKKKCSSTYVHTYTQWMREASAGHVFVWVLLLLFIVLVLLDVWCSFKPKAFYCFWFTLFTLNIEKCVRHSLSFHLVFCLSLCVCVCVHGLDGLSSLVHTVTSILF